MEKIIDVVGYSFIVLSLVVVYFWVGRSFYESVWEPENNPFGDMSDSGEIAHGMSQSLLVVLFWPLYCMKHLLETPDAHYMTTLLSARTTQIRIIGICMLVLWIVLVGQHQQASIMGTKWELIFWPFAGLMIWYVPTLFLLMVGAERQNYKISLPTELAIFCLTALSGPFTLIWLLYSAEIEDFAPPER